MKTNLLVNRFSGLLLISFLPGFLFGQLQKKVYSEAFSRIREAQVNHRYGDLLVIPATDGQLRYEATLSLEGEAGEAQKVFNHFQVEKKATGDGIVLISTFGGFSQKKTITGKSIITFADGVRVKDIRNLKVKMILYVPPLQTLRLENKYADMELAAGVNPEQLRVRIDNGKLRSADLTSKLELEIKYGEAEIKSLVDAELEVYDSELEIGSANQIKLDSKYSDIELGDVANFTGDLYDDNISIGNIEGQLLLQDKYSDIKGQTFRNARFDLYDSQLEFTRGDDVQIKTKYSKIRFERLNSIDFQLSYDDEVRIGYAKILASHTKYTAYEIDELEHTLRLDSHDDDIRIRKFTGPYEKIVFDGKYTDLELNLDPEAVYHLDVRTKYGDLKLPERKLVTNRYIEKNGVFEIYGSVNDADESAPTVNVRGYDCDIRF